MSNIIMYQQGRADGGIRTGVEIDGATALMDFQEGLAEDDPALRWYIDVALEGEMAPQEAEDARQWLLDSGPAVARVLIAMAEDVRLGVDPTIRPVERHTPGAIPGIEIKICASAVRRAEAREIADKLISLAREWDDAIGRLKPLANV
jgi:hypothetical protein